MRGLVPQHVAQRSAEFFAIKALNGYAPLFGSSAPVLQDMITEKGPRSEWPAAPFSEFDPVKMSYDGCGGCYRVPAIGLAFRGLSNEELRVKVCEGVLLADGDYEGAFMIAKAISLILDYASPSVFQPLKFLKDLKESMATIVEEPLSLGYKVASNQDSHEGIWHYTEGQPQTKASVTWYTDSIDKIEKLHASVEKGVPQNELYQAEEAAGLRHNSCSPFPGRAVDTVPLALWHFILRWRTPKECLSRCILSGGDTTTIAALSAGLLGALHGHFWISRSWMAALENGLHGRDYSIRTARQLHAVFGVEEGG